MSQKLNPVRMFLGKVVCEALTTPFYVVTFPFILAEMLADWYAFTASRWIQARASDAYDIGRPLAVRVGNLIAGYKP